MLPSYVKLSDDSVLTLGMKLEQCHLASLQMTKPWSSSCSTLRARTSSDLKQWTILSIKTVCDLDVVNRYPWFWSTTFSNTQSIQELKWCSDGTWTHPCPSLKLTRKPKIPSHTSLQTERLSHPQEEIELCLLRLQTRQSELSDWGFSCVQLSKVLRSISLIPICIWYYLSISYSDSTYQKYEFGAELL